MSIGELARRSGVPATTIRYYDSLGLIGVVERRSGRRRFPDEAVRRLGVVQALRKGGFSLTEIATLLAPAKTTIDDRQRIVASRLEDVRASIRRLQRIEAALLETIDCGCSSLEHCDRMRLPVDDTSA